MIVPGGPLLIFVLGFSAAAAAQSAAPADPGQQLDPSRLEALHQQRVEWMKTRRSAATEPAHGLYQDLRVATAPPLVLPFRVQELARQEGIQVLLTDREPRLHNGVLWLETPRNWKLPDLPNLLTAIPKGRELKRLIAAFRQYPVEFAGLTGGAFSWLQLEPGDAPLAPIARHVLARELNAKEVQRSIAEGRTYTAEEWLCDASGFAFWAVNNQGVFEIGDRFPLQDRTRFEIRLPVKANVKLYRDGQLIAEHAGVDSLQAAAPGPGAYHLEASLKAAGEVRPWIRTEPIHLTADPMPAMPKFQYADETVTAVRNVPYIDNTIDNTGDPKQRLDLYLPKAKSSFPVLVFIHGGGWSSGDRSLYGPIGLMLAKRGIGVAIPSYRLMPKNPHPAQVEDAAAAVSWVVRNIGKYPGADPARIFIAGHSAGAHLSALIALDPSHLRRYGIDNPSAVIKGVGALSGAYDLSFLPMFGDLEARRKASPMQYVRKDAPPFLVTYCQWDYLTLPQQAKDLTLALKKAFVPARLVYVEARTHITEVLSMLSEGDVTTEALVHFIESGQP